MPINSSIHVEADIILNVYNYFPMSRFVTLYAPVHILKHTGPILSSITGWNSNLQAPDGAIYH